MSNAGVSIVLGTDANSSPFVLANPPFGESIIDELAPFVAVSISNVGSLRGATSLAAAPFDFTIAARSRLGGGLIWLFFKMILPLTYQILAPFRSYGLPV